ncbi:hypothetical protein LTR10_018069 [Elasticomyces elasticus]|uniref:BZIP domain-containing protein n=1 Tax=Exophiala sideris TaxID=1016849 RepID=A0ABR0JR47_9EURO|nr:hypothetical protein LTR10_018069 [Elasticomyces elasticus]KAK5039527.1 hypothetical protein LTS07_000021 [Exophiala sideris]KAK5041080.1 hypothetical protein LTR13_002554 [Exophiala sideris]KAK5067904.1 hypothetical protein LTR69_000021 [Exophiala sideris]KAK5187206.1 hypothetical protein LTR44_000021 [Eurotiomycetes sp. CCFEE 6388]
MSSYRGRTGPNFSEYLNNLNTLAAPFDQENFSSEEFELNQDLAMFTNTDFTHFDIPSLPEDGSFRFDLNENKNNPVTKYDDILPTSDAVHNYPPPPIETSAADSNQYFSTYNTPIQPAPAQGFGNADNLGPSTAAPVAAALPSRRKADSVDSNMHAEDKSRVIAEEDKRRRNTAASARFRIKKKQREQALENTVKDVQDKNAKLEARLKQLEMENKWLKELITEKNGLHSKEEMAAAYRQYHKESEERDLKENKHTTGVGTQ